MNVRRDIGLTTMVICAIAVVFHVYSAVTEWNNAVFAFVMIGWSLAPYLAGVLLGIFTKRPLVGAISAPLALAVDLQTYLAVRSSDSSTAAIDFLWAPVFNLVLVVPFAALIAFLFLRLRKAGRNAP